MSEAVRPTTTLVFASCAKLQRVNPQPVWERIRKERPDAVLLLGDTVYVEDDAHLDPKALAADLRARLGAQLAEPNFAALRADLTARGAPFLAIYDDHDFIGDNRYGGDFDPALRDAARVEFQRAFSPERVGTEAYTACSLPRVDVVLLDVRFHRMAPARSRGDRDAILGPRQWAWLEERVAASRAPYLVVASSTTFHAFADESWEEYPAAFSRLRSLLCHRRGAVVVAGDVHRNALYDDSGVIEVVSSGVAGKGMIFEAYRQNYGVLTFDDDAMHIELRALKVHGRFDVRVPLTEWTLP